MIQTEPTLPPVTQIDPLREAFPENMPCMHGPLVRWLGRTVLKLGGWRLIGRLPNQGKVVIIVAPHTSYWDGFSVSLANLQWVLKCARSSSPACFGGL